MYGIKEFQPKNVCHSFVGTAIIGASVVGAGASIYGATKAASAQEQAANTAANEAQQQFDVTQSNLAPYRQIGGTASDQLTQMLPTLTAPVVMNEAALKQTPGYQFNLTQGLKSVQNSAAARGLGVSGAALKGASTFATGLADSTYQNQFSNAVTNQTNAYNRLAGLVNTGEAAAAGNVPAAATTGAVQANAAIQGGNAAAAGYNALGTNISNATNNLAGYTIAKGLYGNSVAPNNTNSYAIPVQPDQIIGQS
jgi:hypothetical protein